MLNSPYDFKGGCYFYRNHLPGRYLRKKGHVIREAVLGNTLPDELLNYPDVVIFSRTYAVDPLAIMRKYKAAGKKVIYEVDDCLWEVNPDNPSAAVATEQRHQYETLMKEVDAITTTTKVLADKLRKLNDNIFVCPNGIDLDYFHERPHQNKELVIGYTGAASHWADLQLVTQVLAELQKKHPFQFVIMGMTGPPIDDEMYGYQQIIGRGLQPEKNAYMKSALKWYEIIKTMNFLHVPFFSPELYGEALARCDMDIGIAPLLDNNFNHSKSCIKFYEYATMGTVTLASKVLPYKNEVNYLAKNKFKDWYKKLERLIVDEPFREKLLAEQRKWVRDNRLMSETVKSWEKAIDIGSKATDTYITEQKDEQECASCVPDLNNGNSDDVSNASANTETKRI